MHCRWMQRHLNAYVDGELSGLAALAARLHLQACPQCFERYERAESVEVWAQELASPPPPPDLSMRLRVALSHEAAREGAWRRSWTRLKWRVRESFQPMALRAAGGVAAALALFAVLMPDLATVRAGSEDDVPLTYLAKGFVSPPSVSELTPLPVVRQNFVVLAYVGADGTLYDIELPEELEGDERLRAEIANALLFTRFEPAMKFGRPVLGRVLISFTRYNVKG